MILCHTLSVSAVRSEVTVNSSCCCAQEKLNLTQKTTPVTCNCPWKLSEQTRLQRSETELEMMLGVLLTDARYGCLINSCSSCTCDCRAKRAVPLSSIRGSNSESVSIDSMLNVSRNKDVYMGGVASDTCLCLPVCPDITHKLLTSFLWYPQIITCISSHTI